MELRSRNPTAFCLLLLLSLFAIASAKVFFEERFEGISHYFAFFCSIQFFDLDSGFEFLILSLLAIDF